MDTVDFSGYGADQLIDLTVAVGSSVTGTVSNIGGMIGNMTLAVGTIIENAIGGGGNDQIIGNDYDNELTGNAGDDLLNGAEGIDTATYSGARSDYGIAFNADNTVTIEYLGAGAGDGTDTLVDIEAAAFADQTVDLTSVPDLVAENLAFDSTTWELGDFVNANWDVVNQGSGGARFTESTLYISSDSIVDATDAFLYEDIYVASLEPGERLNQSNLFQIPDHLVPGVYYVAAIADSGSVVAEGLETNNVSNVVQITIEPSGPDLIAENLALESTNWRSGDVIAVDWDIVNQGDEAAASSASTLYLSTNDVIMEFDTELLKDPATGTLLPGDHSAQGQPNSFTVSGNLASGTYYVGVLADDGGDVDESDETNNASDVIRIVIEEPVPGRDLVAENLVFETTTWSVGDVIGVNWDIVNRGDTAAGISASRLYLSSNTIITPADIMLLEDPSTGAMSPGERNPEGEPNNFMVHGDLAPGTYYAAVIADDDFAVFESNENNNTSNLIEITIEEPQDAIYGTPLRDLLQGTGEGDVIYALAGNDLITGGGGSDLIDGDAGRDTVIYDGLRSAHSHQLSQNGRIVVDKPGGGTDMLYDIERIDFDDGSLLYDVDTPNLGFGYRIYQASFDRTPDEGGVLFWIGNLDHFDTLGWSQYEKEQFLATQFIQSDEFKDLFGANPTNERYIDAMYLNVLDRLPDQGGYDFWVGGMEQGLTREDILIAFTKSDENVSRTAPDLDDGVWVI